MNQSFGRTLNNDSPKKEKGSAGGVVLRGKGKTFNELKKELEQIKEKEPCFNLTVKEKRKK